jgi:predicted HAD superfamily Cof-like phosphohydrolase
MPLTQAQSQAEFMRIGEQLLPRLKEVLSWRNPRHPQVALYDRLITEEMVKELSIAINHYYNSIYPDERLAALADLCDAICDAKVVLSGLANTLGLPEDMAYEEVHRSNMRKYQRGIDGKLVALKRADGKIIKPKDWAPPDILNILKYKLITEL